MASIADIASLLGAEAEFTGAPAPDLAITGPGLPGRAEPGCVIFIGKSAKNPADLLSRSEAGLAIIDHALTRHWNPQPGITAVIRSADARLDFSRVLNHFFVPQPVPGIHPTAVVEPGAVIGERVCIGPGCVVCAGVEIGDDCILHGRAFLAAGTRLGRRVRIHAGAVIGADGFGYARRPDATWEKFPHLGGVVIEDDVEIGANTTIDRGTLGDTVIRQGVKIDNLVHIAHNAEIGPRTLVAASAVVCGSARIGADVWLSPLSCVRDRTSVSDGCLIGMGAIIDDHVPAGTTMAGTSARTLRDTARINRFLRKSVEAG